jgi:hypothetical protein
MPLGLIGKAAETLIRYRLVDVNVYIRLWRLSSFVALHFPSTIAGPG